MIEIRIYGDYKDCMYKYYSHYPNNHVKLNTIVIISSQENLYLYHGYTILSNVHTLHCKNSIYHYTDSIYHYINSYDIRYEKVDINE